MSRIAPDNMQIAMSDGPLVVRIADAGDMAMLRVSLPAGTDYTEPLRSVSPNHCEVPHWMYVIAGELHIPHNDGRIDVAKAGEMIYAEPGHTARCPVDTEFFEVSPREPIRKLIAALTGG
jgi:hypothetical protein